MCYENSPCHSQVHVDFLIFLYISEAKEVHGAFGTIWAPEEAKVYNPAFDVTPLKFITSFVLDTGVLTREEIAAGKLRELESLRH